MKSLHTVIKTVVLLIGTAAFAQEVVRTPFLEIGNAPIRYNYTIDQGNGYLMQSVFSANLDKKVEEVVKAQKQAGFKKFDQATFLFAPQRILASTYPVEAGYTYRIIAVTHTKNNAFILRAVNEAGDLVVPEERIGGPNNGYIADVTVQLKDFVCTKSGTIQIVNSTLSTDQYDFDSVRYLIFKKKS